MRGAPVTAGPEAPVTDVAIIGAGVVGTAIARTLARYRLSCVLIDAANDVGTGTSKANTAILHTGFDAPPGSLEARLLRRGSALLHDYARRTGIPVERTGALLVAWNAEEQAALPGIEDKARRNGYTAVRPVGPAELYRREPHLGPGATGALEIPDESIICPWTTPLAYATEAVRAGVRLLLGHRVTGVSVPGASASGASASGASASGIGQAPGAGAAGVSGGAGKYTGEYRLTLAPAGPATARPTSALRCRWVVNAAGLHSDTIDRMFAPEGFTIRPRRGELIVLDKLARPLLGSILLPVPTARTKGVLVAPTVYGNVLIGPTADDIGDRSDVATTATGLTAVLAAGHRIVPSLAAEEVTATYAGLRAATEHRDYQIHIDPARRYARVAGIRSTGLSASLGIAEYVAGQLGDAGLPLRERDVPAPPVMPSIGEAGVRPYQDPDRIAADPQYGLIVCHCERVSRGEIRDALASVIPPADVSGLSRRTRALNGRCQGFYCGAAVSRLLAGHHPRPSGHPAPEPSSASAQEPA
ncbi:MAG: NAD(P)/FAD-dependent oxidoreductase [Streptosporangiaceae bacterium]